MDFSPTKIRKVIRVFAGYDILHFHSFHPATAYAAVKSRKKILYTEHGNFGFGRKQTLNDKVTRRLLRVFLNNNCDYITFNSGFSQETAITRYGLSGKTNVGCVQWYSGKSLRRTNDTGRRHPYVLRQLFHHRLYRATC